jgi:hypothetical protein
MTNAELDLLRQIAATGTSFVPEGTRGVDRDAFRVMVHRIRSLVAQGLVAADYLMSKRPLESDPLAVFCSLTELGQLALAADRLMPASISYTVDHQSRTVLSKARGLVAPSDHEAHIRGLVAAGVFAYRRLEDYRGAWVEVSPPETRRMVATVNELRREHRYPRTAYVTRDDVLYGMLRMYEAMSAEHDHGFAVFLDRGEAEAWIGRGDQAPQLQGERARS